MPNNFSEIGVFRTDFNYLEEVYGSCLNRYHINPKYKDFRRALNDISNGRKILEHDEEVDIYIALYGAHHYYKLTSAFDTLDLFKFIGKPLEIFSYGCGPATDTCVFISYLASKKINLSINSLTLIEPSAASLDRGEQYVQSALIHKQAGLKIRTVNKKLDNLDITDVSSQSQTIKLHVFSNILDIEHINLKHLANILNISQKGSNYFICVSPNFYSSIKRIDNFRSIMSTLFQIWDISMLDEAVRGRFWLMTARCFVDNQGIGRYQRIFMTYVS